MEIQEPKFKKDDHVIINTPYSPTVYGVIEKSIYDYNDKCWKYKCSGTEMYNEKFLSSKSLKEKIYIYSYLNKKNKIKTYVYSENDNIISIRKEQENLSKKYKPLGIEIFEIETKINLE